MTIVGKLFGLVGQISPAPPRAPEHTACPGFGWRYTLQMAEAYEESLRRRRGSVVELLRSVPCLRLPLAA